MQDAPDPAEDTKAPAPRWRRLRGSQKFLIAAIVLVGIAGLQAHFLFFKHAFHSTAVLYVGVPLLLAFVFAMADPAKTAMGATLKGITIFLLLSAPILQEGFICILFAAPIIYAVGAIIAGVIDHHRRKNGRTRDLMLHPLVLVLIALSFEGTHESLSFKREQIAEASKIVAATPAEVERQLAAPARLSRAIPWISRIFPRPIAHYGEGLNVGDLRGSRSVYRKHIWFNAKVGETVYRISERAPGRVVFSLVEDTSYIANYLRWGNTTVLWEPLDANHTKVTWRIAFERKLDPAWYFAPLEQFFVALAAEVFIDNLATPAPPS